MEKLYGVGWESRPEVVAAYQKLGYSRKFAFQRAMDRGELYGEDESYYSNLKINEMIEDGTITVHGRI